MAEARRDAERSPQSRPPRQHGLLYNLVWGWPWALVGLILSSLLLSLLIEYAGMTFFWPDEGGGTQSCRHEYRAGLAVDGVHAQPAAVHAVSDGTGLDFRGVSVAVCGKWYAVMAAAAAGGNGGGA